MVPEKNPTGVRPHQRFLRLLPGWAYFSRGDFFTGTAVALGIGAALGFLASPWGRGALPGLVTLGTKVQYRSGFDLVPGDHSLHMLVDGLLVLVLLWWMGFLWVSSFRAGGKQAGRLSALVVPGAVLLTVFALLPMGATLAVGFTDYRAPDHLPPLNLLHWSGFGNFTALFQTGALAGTFLPVLGWNLLWALGVTGMSFLGAMVLSELLAPGEIPFRGFLQGVFFLPYVLPSYFTLVTFRSLLGPQGAVNRLLEFLGLPALGFLTHPGLAKITALGVGIWLTLPFFLLALGGMRRQIPPETYEAARLEGAGPVLSLWYITLPLVWRKMRTPVFLSFLFQFNNFQGIYLLTGGGPGAPGLHYAGETDILLSWIYKLTLQHGLYNLAAVLTLGIFLILAVLLLAYRTGSRQVGDRAGGEV